MTSVVGLRNAKDGAAGGCRVRSLGRKPRLRLLAKVDVELRVDALDLVPRNLDFASRLGAQDLVPPDVAPRASPDDVAVRAPAPFDPRIRTRQRCNRVAEQQAYRVIEHAVVEIATEPDGMDHVDQPI